VRCITRATRALVRDVAIKLFPGDRVADEDRRRRFVQEAQAASALNHPHIITIHEIETAGAHDFIVMEYVRGKSLDTLIPRQGMRLDETLRIGIAVATPSQPRIARHYSSRFETGQRDRGD
jgi:serine/threonine protein kinase